jgi:NifU-like protein involved in Fe-S cluster formation
MPVRQIVLMLLRKAQVLLQICKGKTFSKVSNLLADAQAMIMNEEFPGVNVYEKKVLNFMMEEQKNKKPSRWTESQDYFHWYEKMDKA